MVCKTACCLANITRLIASLGNYVYANNDNGIWVNLLWARATSIFSLKNGNVGINMETNYPWTAKLILRQRQIKKMQYALACAHSGWCNKHTGARRPVCVCDNNSVTHTLLTGPFVYKNRT